MGKDKHRDPAGLIRFGVSIEKKLLDLFDRLISKRGYRNRSEAIRDLIRDKLVEEEWAGGTREVVGTLTLIYDHHTRELQARMTELQHTYHAHVISTLHVHLDHHNCLEVLVVRGRPREIRALSDGLLSLKGVKHGRLAATTSGKMIA
jgi:CopG family nickel-responsive transcriptional regulator